MQNYPNPFNTSTVISYTLIKSFETKLKIYNTTGKEITTLVNGFQSAGTYQLVWDGKDTNSQLVPSGVYFYRLEAGNLFKIKQMTVVR